MQTQTIEKKHINKLLIILLGFILTVLLHELWKDPVQDVTRFPPSGIRTFLGSMKPLLAPSLLILFLVIGYTFLGIQKMIPAPKHLKAWYYGIPAGGLWVLGMTELAPWRECPFGPLVFSGLADLIPIVLISILLGKYCIVESSEFKTIKRKAIPSAFFIPTMYIAGRYFSYYVLKISSGIDHNPFGTFIWTILMGCWIFVMYYFMGVDTWNTTPFKKALIFGGLIFGLIWVSFNAIGALISSDFYIFLDRTLIDTVAVMASVYISALLQQKKNEE